MSTAERSDDAGVTSGPLPYFPFDKDTFGLSMGVKPLGREPVFVIDPARYEREIALKTRNMSVDRRYRVQATPESDPVVWECVHSTLSRLATEHPSSFAFEEVDGACSFENRITGEIRRFRMGDPSTLPAPPLAWLGAQVHEDLCLLDGTDPDVPLVAGCLCFPSMWSLDEKLGRSLLDIHTPVPFFHDKIGRSTMLLMERLKEPVWRLNWGIYPTDRLDLEPISLHEWEERLHQIRAEDAGERLYLRVERQTLSRLPKTRAILFTIHTFVGTIADQLTDDAKRTRLYDVLRTVPPESQKYKRLAPYLPQLLSYLSR